MTEWRNIPNFPMYDISDEGEVRSRYTGQLKKISLSPDGYPFLALTGADGKHKRIHLHVVVALAFPSGSEAWTV